MNMKDPRVKGHLAILLTNIIFGVNVPLAKTVMGEGGVPWQVASAIRIAVAALLFWGASLLFPRERVGRRDLGLLFLASLFAVTLYQPPFLMGLELSSPFNASMLSNTLPIVTLILATILLREPLSGKKVMGVALGIVGAAMLVMRPGETFRVGSVGDLLVFFSLVSYALYLTLFKGVVLRYSAVTVMKWLFLFSFVCTTPFCVPAFDGVAWASFDLNFYLRLGYLSVFATFIAYFLLPVAQRGLRPTVISMYSYVNPIVAGSIALATGMDSITPLKIIAVVLIFVGVYLVTISKSRVQVEREGRGGTQRGAARDEG